MDSAMKPLITLNAHRRCLKFLLSRLSCHSPSDFFIFVICPPCTQASNTTSSSVTGRARGEKDEALKWFKSAYEMRDFWILFTRVTPDLDIIKDDPEVKKVMNDIGL